MADPSTQLPDFLHVTAASGGDYYLSGSIVNATSGGTTVLEQLVSRRSGTAVWGRDRAHRNAGRYRRSRSGRARRTDGIRNARLLRDHQFDADADSGEDAEAREKERTESQ